MEANDIPRDWWSCENQDDQSASRKKIERSYFGSSFSCGRAHPKASQHSGGERSENPTEIQKQRFLRCQRESMREHSIAQRHKSHKSQRQCRHSREEQILCFT